ncbi:MAG: flagellar motor protein MotB [Thermodesulfobacteriota bacterium]
MADDDERKPEQKAGAPAWMCTFADLMSLLLCFFVLLLSFSVMDQNTYKVVSGSLKDAFGIQTERRTIGSIQGQRMISPEFQSVPLDVQVMVQEELSEEVASGAVEVVHDEEGMTLRVNDAIAFDTGSAEIKPGFAVILDKIGRVAATKTDMLFEVSGHTDNVPIQPGGRFSSNFDLSAARAVAVIDHWQKRQQIPADRVFAAGYADGRPLESNETVAGRARNRRVEFKIRPKGSKFAFSGIEELLPVNQEPR